MKVFNLTLLTLATSFLTVTSAPSYSTGNQNSPDNNHGSYKHNSGGHYGGNYDSRRPSSHKKRPNRRPTRDYGDYDNESNESPSYDTSYSPKAQTQQPSYGQTTSTPSKGGFDIQLMLQLVNAERAKKGASPLKLNQQLVNAAQAHSDDQARSRDMSHSGSDGSSPSDRCKKAGYGSSTIGENIAWNQKDVNEVMKTWISSPGHYANIINKSYKEFGAGMNALYWTQNFGGGESGSSNNNNGGYGSGKSNMRY